MCREINVYKVSEDENNECCIYSNSIFDELKIVRSNCQNFKCVPQIEFSEKNNTVKVVKF